MLKLCSYKTKKGPKKQRQIQNGKEKGAVKHYLRETERQNNRPTKLQKDLEAERQ